MTDSFPRQQARTRRFTLGVPRAFQISPDGARVAFLRTRGGSDPVTCLWEADTVTGAERLVADPRALGADDENLPPAERARRERVRETAAGIVSFATDAAGGLAVFALSGHVYAARLGDPSATPRLIATHVPALDPRPDPAGRKVAYTHDGALRVVDLTTGDDTLLAAGADATFGLAEFVAAEEMGRSRGYWWSPDGTRICVARVDESEVRRWYIADPANPGRPPAEVGYPAAGTPNADVSLFIVNVPEEASPPPGGYGGQEPPVGGSPGGPCPPPGGYGGREPPVGGSPGGLCPPPGGYGGREPPVGGSPGGLCPPGASRVDWDREAFPYLVTVAWDDDLLVVTQSRDQKTMRLCDGITGEVIIEDRDPHWTDIIPGAPAILGDGRLVWTRISEDTRRLIIAPAAGLAAAAPLTPPGLQVREILSTDGASVLLRGWTEATEVGVWRYGPDGLAEVATEPGVHTALAAGGTTVTSSRTLRGNHACVRIDKDGKATAEIASLAEEPNLPQPQPRFLNAGPTGIRTAVLFPSWHQPGSKLPVLMDPYGGPHSQRVLKTASAFLTSQWFAEQGFAVVVADGRGTPGRGPAWDRMVAGDLATGVLEDQVTALHAAADKFADLDVSRVGIRGWSFGGYLSALAVLRRPDIFHAGIAGAPVTDWRLYDTHYTERYLGDPARNPAAYEASSLNVPPGATPSPRARLLIIHGLADDNVFVAHSLRLSAALLAAGYPHSVLPLSGVTHMTPQEVVAENLLLLQIAFLRSALSGGDQPLQQAEAGGAAGATVPF